MVSYLQILDLVGVYNIKQTMKSKERKKAWLGSFSDPKINNTCFNRIQKKRTGTNNSKTPTYFDMYLTRSQQKFFSFKFPTFKQDFKTFYPTLGLNRKQHFPNHLKAFTHPAKGFILSKSTSIPNKVFT